VKIFIIGAGQVGSTIVEALHGEHELTVVDEDPSRVEAIGSRFDVATVTGNGTSRRVLEEGGLEGSDLLIACTSRDEVNIIASIFCRALTPSTRTIVRTGNEEYLDV
jgi:trk system potassium uptake protein